MSYLLDTNTCIRYLNGQSESIRGKLESKQPEEIVVCSVVKAELFYGALKSARANENLEKAHRFLDRLVSLPFDDNASEEYGKVRSKLEMAGTPIGPNDLLIAAIAVVRRVILVTHNTKEFGRVKGLKLEDWEK